MGETPTLVLCLGNDIRRDDGVGWAVADALAPAAQAVIRRSALSGKDMEERLDEVLITVNRNTVPYDERPPAIASGVRIGTKL